MSLLKNDLPLTEKDRDFVNKTVLERFPNLAKKNVRLKVLPGLIKADPKYPKQAPDFPNIMISFTESVSYIGKDKVPRTDKWQYYEQSRVVGKNTLYDPAMEQIDSVDKEFSIHDIDRLFFYLYCSPQVKNGLNPKKGVTHYLYFEDKEKENEDILVRETKVNKIKQVILDENITEDQIREFGSAMFIKGAREMTIKELQVHFIKMMSTPANIDLILNVIGKDVSLFRESRAMVQQLQDLDLVLMDKHTWYEVENGVKGDFIVKINQGEDPNVALQNAIMGDKDLLERYKKSIAAHS